jgi:hypothetical protein
MVLFVLLFGDARKLGLFRQSQEQTADMGEASFPEASELLEMETADER